MIDLIILIVIGAINALVLLKISKKNEDIDLHELQSRLKQVELEWNNTYEKLQTILGRIMKRNQIESKQETNNVAITQKLKRSDLIRLNKLNKGGLSEQASKD